MADMPIETRRAPLAARGTPRTLDEAARTVEVTWSTGAAVERWGALPGGSYGRYLEELSLDPAHVDLSRLRSGANVLDTHAAGSVREVIGVVEAAAVDGQRGTATIRFSERADVEPIWQDVKAGILRNLSVGYSIERVEWLDAARGELPRCRVTGWTPLELSVCAIPADPRSQVRAMPMETSHMSTQAAAAVPPAAAAADPGAVLERRRASEILAIASRHKLGEAFAREHIAAGSSVDAVRTAALDYLVAQQEATPTRGTHDYGMEAGPDALLEDAATALAHRLNPAIRLEGRARELRGLRFPALMGELLAARGERVRWLSDRQIMQRAGGMHSTDLPALLGNAQNKALLPLFEAARSGLRQVAYVDQVRDFKEASRVRAGEFPSLAKVNELGEYTNGAVGEERETFRLSKFGRMLHISMEALINDDLGALADMTRSAALAAASLEADQLALAVTSNPAMADGKAVFHADHGNLAGTPGPITVASVQAGKAAMRLQRGVDGKTVLNVQPRYIVVPAAQEAAAEAVTGQLYPAVVGESNAPVRNLEVVADPRLDGSSSTAWHLFADPAFMPSLSVAYLESEPTPYIEVQQGWRIDGTEWKVRWALATYWSDWRGAYRNAGANS